MTVPIRLSWHEVSMAAIAGVQRNVQALARDRARAYGSPKVAWDLHVEGACAELAVAKYTGRYWEPVWSQLDNSRGDVGGWQVRSTPRADGKLILHEADPDDAPFVLVVGSAPNLLLVGWIFGSEGKRPEWWRTDTGRPAFFVPQSALHHMGDSRAVAA